jgi:cell fate (sporulation/competence/biofilm development) regulator YlbF (YheA/YmcA/DUF963 family)
MNFDIIGFFLNEYHTEKKKERALLRHDMAEAIFMAYRGSQPKVKGQLDNSFSNFKKFLENLRKECMEGYDEIKHKKMIEEGKKTWADLKSKKRIKF